MSDRSLTTDQILTGLAETPQRIAALTADLTPAQLRTTPNHNEIIFDSDRDNRKVRNILANPRVP